MNQRIYNLQRYLSEEGIACHVRMGIPGPAHLIVDTLQITHSDTKNMFVMKSLSGHTTYIRNPKYILLILKEHYATTTPTS